MKNLSLKVISIPWENIESQECTIEFETLTGQKFTAYSYSDLFKIGETYNDVSFSILDFELEGDEIEFEDYFKGNINNEKKLLKLGEWKYIAFGQIVDIENHDAIVDCGGVLIPLCNLTSDRRCIGEYVKFSIERLDAYILC